MYMRNESWIMKWNVGSHRLFFRGFEACDRSVSSTMEESGGCAGELDGWWILEPCQPSVKIEIIALNFKQVYI